MAGLMLAHWLMRGGMRPVHSNVRRSVFGEDALHRPQTEGGVPSGQLVRAPVSDMLKLPEYPLDG